MPLLSFPSVLGVATGVPELVVGLLVLVLVALLVLTGRALLAAQTVRDELASQTEELLEEQRAAAQHKLDLEEKNRELGHLSQAKSEFLAAMSHELRTPLNAVIGFAELLTEGVAGEVNEGQREYLNDIRLSGTHLLRLINDILDYSKLEAGKLQLQNEVVNLASPVREAVGMLQANAQKKGVLLTETCDDGLSVVGDPLRLKQVVLNLVANAVKFTPRGGTVSVSLSASNSRAILAVKDTGIGIAAEHQVVIFEAFHQVDGETRRRFEGTGLGLALVKKLLEPMAGSVRVESENGKGATFVVEMPCTQAARVLAPASRRVEGIEVVIAEDDDATRHMLGRVLQANGCVVRSAANGQRALEALLEKLPDVLVLDLMMPELDGYAVLERLRALPEGGAVKVLVFSATEPAEERRLVIEQLGAQVLVKGTVATQELVSVVARLARSREKVAA